MKPLGLAPACSARMWNRGFPSWNDIWVFYFPQAPSGFFINNRYIHNTMNNLCLISKHWCVILVSNCVELADVCPFDSLFILRLTFPPNSLFHFGSFSLTSRMEEMLPSGSKSVGDYLNRLSGHRFVLKTALSRSVVIFAAAEFTKAWT